jgi:hypothetical protein
MNPAPAVFPTLAERLFGGQPERRVALLRAVWPHAVGAELARRTRVLELRGATMRVAVPDAAWRKVLHGMQATLRSRLRARVGALAPTRLSFQELPLGDEASAPSAPTTARVEPSEAPLGEALLAAAAIADDEIRERFLHSAARALARRARSDASKESQGA